MSNLNSAIGLCCALLWSASAIVTLAQTGAISAPASTFRIVHTFDGTDGSDLFADLVQGTNGKLYGTTFGGGKITPYCNFNDGAGCGTVFRMTAGGKLTSLYTFCSQGGDGCTDGVNPDAGLIQGTDGNFYGTTSHGGTGYDNEGGTVFSITPSGKLTTLYSFCSQGGKDCTDGANPEAALVQGDDGDLYGTTHDGGGNTACNCGTIFKTTPSGKLTTLHSFCSHYKDGYCEDGLYPGAGLVQGMDGKFYGTTEQGGVNSNAGTIFSITPSGVLTTLYSFDDSCTNGCEPRGGLVQGTDGNFYGTTGGTVFKTSPSGKLTTLYTFCPADSTERPCPQGADPVAALVQGTDGNFYGTTEHGGNDNGGCGTGCGTIFQITPSGKLTSLYDFCSQTKCADGELPMAGLVQDTSGTFYGTAIGGTFGYGVVYSLSMGLGPFVVTEPAYGKAGKAVKILGTDLTGTTSVIFNGTAATFTVVSASEITTTVPTGATTGPVRVITPSGKLQSNVPFRVN
jgi:uncharacterized repeat protein (TIGR03803 family)